MKKIYLISMLAAMICGSCQEKKTELYAREAKEMTEQCPMILGKYIRMDSVAYFEPTNEFVYYYMMDSQMSMDSIEPKYVRQELLNQIKNSPEMMPYIKDSMTFRYVYRTASSGEVVMDFRFEPKEFH